MIIIETLAHKIASKISLQLDFDDDRKSVIAYGLIGILQISTILVILLTIGILFDFWYESMIIYIGVGLMRKSTGGAHSRSMNGCIIISVLSIVIMSYLSRHIMISSLNKWANLGISILVFTACLIVFYIRVPMDNANKPIVTLHKIKRLRKQSYVKLGFLFFLSVICIQLIDFNNRFYSIAISIRMSMLWVLLTLTKPGILILGKFDAIINWIIRTKEE